MTDGLFTTPIDFGNVFTGTARYLQSTVRCPSGGGSYTTLSPRQALTPAPCALALPGLYTQQNATSPNVIGGHISNTVSVGVVGATIGGGGASGFPNQVSANYATVGGGFANTASGMGAFIGGGGTDGTFFLGNVASGNASTIGGGISNTIGINATSATVGGGRQNTASGSVATVGGGGGNTANSGGATVSGGYVNTASGNYATVPGGHANSAANSFTLAAGRRAKANHVGAFVWGDSTDADIASTANDQFIVRASGGMRLYGAGNWDLGATEGDWRIGNDTDRLKIGVALAGGGAGDVWMRAQGGTEHMYIWTPGGMTIYSNAGQTLGVQLAANGTSWSSISDRNLKENLARVDGREILQRLNGVPIYNWNAKGDNPSIRHIGPMAQDFYAAFNVGEDDKHITTIDADGVALTAIQGLYEVVQDEIKSRDAKITSQQKQIDALQSQNADILVRLAALETVGAHGRAPLPDAHVAALEQASRDPKGLGDPSGLGDWNAALAFVVGALGVIMYERARKGGAG